MRPQFVIPVQKQKWMDGSFIWPAKAVFAGERSGDPVALDTLRDEASPYTHAEIQTGRDIPATVAMNYSDDVAHKEGYILDITPSGIQISAQTEAGAYYGVQTLREYTRIHGKILPCIRIEDWPEFAVRGVYFDISRGKVPTIESLKEVIENLAHWKINEFQLYIENVFTFSKHPAIGQGYSPLTPEEILDLQAHCEKHHIRFTPSLASFGHVEKILAIPKYQHLAELPGHLGYPGGTTLNPGSPDSIRLVNELYDEFLPLFNASGFNACCDEPWELGQGASKADADERGKGQVFLDFLLKLYRAARTHGKQMQIWADIVLQHPEILSRIPKDIVMINWEYSGDPAQPGRMEHCALFDQYGFSWVAAPGISSWNTHGTNRANAMHNIRAFSGLARKHHALGILNTHWGDNGARTPHAAILHGLAYGAAHSWHGEGIDEENFTAAFANSLFGQAADLADRLIRQIGNANEQSSAKLYHCYIAPIDPQRDAFRSIDPASPVRWQWSPFAGFIDPPDPKGCAHVIRELSETLALPVAGGLSGGQQLCIEELRLAARMDLVAAKKVILAQRHRAKQPVAPSEWISLANELDEVSAAFEANWLLCNKPSRLADNLLVMKRAEEECRALANG
ncbi:MAG: family 20 glycosylhydrolase [Kiritimatiellaceae bacterium]|nr:family 20 glycosylhydrolase [Kiritimatiellaceae bacterium]